MDTVPAHPGPGRAHPQTPESGLGGRSCSRTPRRALVRKFGSRAPVLCPCLCPFPLRSVLSSLTAVVGDKCALTLLCILLTEKLWFELDYEPGRQPAPRQEGAGIRISWGCRPSAHTPGEVHVPIST